jgi:AcrR family transcriptional regulator
MMNISPIEKSKKLGEKRREQIVYGAIKLFAEKGFHKTTIRDLANETGLSQGNIYYYVKNKEDIFFLIHQYLSEVTTETLLHSIENIDDPIEKLRRLIQAEFNTVDQLSDAILLLYRETYILNRRYLKETLQKERARIEIFETTINECIQSGQLTACNTRMLSNMIKSMIDGWALKRWDLRGYVDRSEAEQNIMDLVFHGLPRSDHADSTVPVDTTDLVDKTVLVINAGTMLGTGIISFLI